jgi:hypothetical protein
VLGNHPVLEGSVFILGPTEDTSYKELSAFAILFAWPELSDDDTLKAAGLQLQQAVVEAARAVNCTIDTVLLLHWIKIGAIKPPSPMGVRSLTNPDDYKQIT